MRKLSNQKKEEILSCVQLLEHGDRIEFDGLSLFVYNSSGCLINSITTYEN